MASRSIRADRARVTTLPATQDAAQRVFAVLGHNGTGDLIEALLAEMDAYDGDADLEDGDFDCCGAGDDQAGRFLHFGTTSGTDDDDREPDATDHSFGDTTGADARHRDRVRRTRCRPRFSLYDLSGRGRIVGHDFKREPTVPRAFKRLRRASSPSNNFSAGAAL